MHHGQEYLMRIVAVQSDNLIIFANLILSAAEKPTKFLLSLTNDKARDQAPKSSLILAVRGDIEVEVPYKELVCSRGISL